ASPRSIAGVGLPTDPAASSLHQIGSTLNAIGLRQPRFLLPHRGSAGGGGREGGRAQPYTKLGLMTLLGALRLSMWPLPMPSKVMCTVPPPVVNCTVTSVPLSLTDTKGCSLASFLMAPPLSKTKNSPLAGSLISSLAAGSMSLPPVVVNLKTKVSLPAPP